MLVQGTAGGLGSFSVQRFKWKRACEIATASPCNPDFLRTLGTDQASYYHATRRADAFYMSGVLNSALASFATVVRSFVLTCQFGLSSARGQGGKSTGLDNTAPSG